METEVQTKTKIWFNGQEAAKFIGISYNTFKNLREAGKLHPLIVSSQVILYDRDQLIEDINSL